MQTGKASFVRLCKMDVAARREHVRVHKLCYNCLIPGHRTTECWNQSTCKTCSGRHHTLVYQTTQDNTPSMTTNTVASSKSSHLPDILMMTSKVMLKGPGGRTLIASSSGSRGGLWGLQPPPPPLLSQSVCFPSINLSLMRWKDGNYFGKQKRCRRHT